MDIAKKNSDCRLVKSRLSIYLIWASRVTFISSFGFLTNVHALDLPPEYEAHYVIKKGFVELGQAVRSLKRTPDGKLTYISDSKATGVVGFFFREQVIQTTEFVFADNHVRPTLYHYYNNRGIEVDQKYDWKKQSVNSVRREKGKDEVFEYEVPNDGYDQNVYQLALMLDLALGRRDMVYAIAENKQLEQYDIRYLRNDIADSPFGKLPVVVIRSVHNDEVTTLWAAPNLYYLPLRIDREEKSISFSAFLTTVNGLSVRKP